MCRSIFLSLLLVNWRHSKVLPPFDLSSATHVTTRPFIHSICEVNQNRLRLSIGMQSMYPKLATNSALFCTTKWTGEVNGTDAIYTNHS